MTFPRLFLTFSDSAKFAEAAKNLYLHHQFQIHHSFFNPDLISGFTSGAGFKPSFLPFNSYFLAQIFRFAPINDNTVAITGLTFLLGSALLVYLISKKVTSHNLPSLFAVLLFLVNKYFVEYALNFTTEITFIFFLLLAIFLLIRRKLILKLLSLLPLLVLFYIRPQAAVVILALFSTAILFYLSKGNFIPKLIKLSLLVALIFLLIGIRYKFNYAVLLGGYAGSLNLPTDNVQGLYLRGGARQELSLAQIFSKTFYNLYNYLRDPSRLFPPLLGLPFLLSFFVGHKKNYSKKFITYFSLTSLSLFLLAASATLPNARYIHPVVPIVFIIASASLFSLSHSKSIKYPTLTFIVLAFFTILPNLGYFTLDYRFRAQQYNIDKPPVYQLISQDMASVISSNQLTITNLDAWASWYQGLTTIWFPYSPDLLADSLDNISYIALTDYNTTDADFALGPWQTVLDHPDHPEDELISSNFTLVKSFTIPASSNYQNQDYHLFILKNNDLSD